MISGRPNSDLLSEHFQYFFSFQVEYRPMGDIRILILKNGQILIREILHLTRCKDSYNLINSSIVLNA